MSHKKFGADRFSRFDVYWIQTNKQTDKPNLYLDDDLTLFRSGKNMEKEVFKNAKSKTDYLAGIKRLGN